LNPFITKHSIKQSPSLTGKKGCSKSASPFARQTLTTHRKTLIRCIKLRLFIAAALLIVGAGPVHATENGLFAGPIGGSDMRSACLPPAKGLYLGAVGLGATYNGLHGNDGNLTPTHPAYYDAGLSGIVGAYVYPWKLGGGALGSTFSQAWDVLQEGIGSRKQSDNGLLDMYTDLLIWSKHVSKRSSRGSEPPFACGLTVSAAYSMVFKDGRYRVTDLTTEGHNYYVFIPNVAVTYLLKPYHHLGDGTEISTRLFYDIPTMNNANGYQSGRVFDVDWAVSERHQRVQAGVSGNYAHQTNSDLKNGVPVSPDGNILVRASVGPVISYTIPKVRATVKGKVLWDYIDRNTFGDRTTATVSIVFKVF